MLDVHVTKRRGAFTLTAAFEMPTPGVAALFGRSGCGKSTLINVIAGLLDADAGRAALDGDVLFDTARAIHVKPERRRIGYVFQDARLFPHLRVGANLRFAARRAKGRAYVTLSDVVDLLDLQRLLDRRTHQLSGGERQRVAIGRALLSQPRLLLLDEPLASLDSARREEVLPYLETLRDQLHIPMVYVSHNFDEVLRLATHVVLMDHGSVVAQGAIDDISLNPHMRAIVGADAVGAVLEGTILGTDAMSGLTRLQVGRGELQVSSDPTAWSGSGLVVDAAVGKTLRVQLLARDIIVAIELPHGLSVRNKLEGRITAVTDDGSDSDLIAIDIGGALVMARVTKAATRELSLVPQRHVWALVKSVSLRPATARPSSTAAGAGGAPLT